MSKFNAYLYDEAKSTRRMQVACIAAACDRDAGKNRAKMVSTIETVVHDHPDVELILFGEMILGWYTPGVSPEYHRQISEPVPGETTQTLASLAQRYGYLYLLWPL